MILSAEDDGDEMHRRLEDIRKFYGARMADLPDIRLIDLVGEDSVLGLLMRGQIEPTPMYHALDEYMAEWKPSLTALDVLADMFGGEENSRVQSRQFIGLLKKLAAARPDGITPSDRGSIFKPQRQATAASQIKICAPSRV